MRRGERFNSISHLVGAVLALVGLIPLAIAGGSTGDGWRVASFAIYGVTLFLLYLMSTLYHGLHGRAKQVFRRLDHAAIYLLIAGTYTPFAVAMGGAVGWGLFAAEWTLATIGIVHASLRPHTSGMRFQVVLCLAMGWICVLGMQSLIQSLPWAGLAWLVAGGLFYTAGVGFFVVDHRVRYAHGVWHLFVLAGSASHYVSVLGYVGV